MCCLIRYVTLHKAPAQALSTSPLRVTGDSCKLRSPTDVLQLRQLLAIKPEQTVVFERFSDSAGGYITLDPNNPQVFKTLIRAAKAKLKLRLKATVSPLPEPPVAEAPAMSEEKTKHKPLEPVIVRTPSYQAVPRLSAAIDGRSVGTGIFQFREARASQQTLVDTPEAPVPHPFTETKSEAVKPSAPAPKGLVFRTRQPALAVSATGHPWSVYCNECDVPMADTHFHCNICDGGDYDLCETCVASGKLCPGEEHWLIKRSIKDGKVISSTTERISPRQVKPEPIEITKEVPGAFTDETKTLAEPLPPTRTCNSCVVVLPEDKFVTCLSCEDFDLCVKCHAANKHGHNPSHGFKAATQGTLLPLASEMLLAPGRNVRHSAICDGCDKKILGVRYKCLNCPDWDYCSECHKSASQIHPRHRFAPLYEPIPEPRGVNFTHTGIYCEGPLCTSKPRPTYIQGVRYKCAVCNDTDFCASCEALPANQHNRTHPLIKFKTPVRNVSITTENEDLSGQMRFMGDKRTIPAQVQTRTASTETTPVPQTNAATQVQTIADIKPAEQNAAIKTEDVKPAVTFARNVVPTTLLNAHFVQDSVSDGTVLEPGARFTQMWTMRNPGPYAWPSGCSVRFVGGDNMLNVDNNRPSAVSDIANATETNVAGRDVQVGEEIAFMVTLKAPAREGKHISYWRMKSADGTPFGHRLWCDIEVKKTEQTKPTNPTAQPPVVMAPGLANSHAFQMKRMQQAQQQMAHQRMARLAAQAPAQPAPISMGPPPPYDASNAANISTRIAAMREAQAKRREHMMQQFNSQVEQFKTPAAQASASSPKFAPVPAELQIDEQARKEAARQRVEHIKAKILRAREEKAKSLMEAEKMRAMEVAKEAAEKKRQEEMDKVQKIINEVAKTEDEKKSEEQLEGSQMVFPKLDKESPASSTYESVSSGSGKGKAAYVENEEGEIEHSAAPSVASPTPAPAALASPTTEEPIDDLDDDIEVLSAHDGEESEDEAFLTDEEYDILDASDHETVQSN